MVVVVVVAVVAAVVGVAVVVVLVLVVEEEVVACLRLDDRLDRFHHGALEVDPAQLRLVISHADSVERVHRV